GKADVTAPGGDSILQVTTAATNGRVLSTFPQYALDIGAGAIDCVRKVFDGSVLYCYLQGTSMASPHVAAVAALLESQGARAGGLRSLCQHRSPRPIDRAHMHLGLEVRRCELWNGDGASKMTHRATRSPSRG